MNTIILHNRVKVMRRSVDCVDTLTGLERQLFFCGKCYYIRRCIYANSHSYLEATFSRFDHFFSRLISHQLFFIVVCRVILMIFTLDIHLFSKYYSNTHKIRTIAVFYLDLPVMHLRV